MIEQHKPRTGGGATETSEGPIPYKRHPEGFDCPVCVKIARGRNGRTVEQVRRGGDGNLVPVPERDELGRLVYALPGGGRWVP